MASTSSSEDPGQFWCVLTDLGGHGAQFEPVGETKTALRDDDYLYFLLTGRRAPSKPLEFLQMRKSRLYDMLWSGLPEILLVSPRFVDLLRSERATGWKTYPVVLLNRKKRLWSSEFLGLAVTGRAGAIQWKRSERVFKPPSVPNGTGYWLLRGAWFEEGSWDGSDVFLPEGSFPMVTDRIARAMRKAGLKGIEYMAQTDFERMELERDRR